MMAVFLFGVAVTGRWILDTRNVDVAVGAAKEPTPRERVDALADVGRARADIGAGGEATNAFAGGAAGDAAAGRRGV